MKFVLVSNILEHPGFFDFVRETSKAHPDCSFLVTGDLLNIFPEPGEDLKGSIFHELYGEMIITEMDNLIKTRFQNLEASPFIQPLQQMFTPLGQHTHAAEAIAKARYEQFFKNLSQALGDTHFYTIPGNMDYPRLAASALYPYPQIHQLDCEVMTVDGVRIGGLGGIPNTVHPYQGIVEISPYEMTEAEYERRLRLMHGVDILLTHISPEEYPPLLDFLRESPLKLLICRAPFNFRRESDFRGKLEIQSVEGKSVIKVRPFDYPINQAMLIELGTADVFDPDQVEIISWSNQQACLTS